MIQTHGEQSIDVAAKCATAPATATATCSDALHFVKLVAVAVAALLLEVSATATLINDKLRIYRLRYSDFFIAN